MPLEPERALGLWEDVRRWPSFVDGLARVTERSSGWPTPGSKVVWESGSGGRGRVTEKVVERADGCFATEVYEERLLGRKTARFIPAGGGCARVELQLEYELAKGGRLGAVRDVLFVRRTLREGLARTLRRFAVEAEDEAGLR